MTLDDNDEVRLFKPIEVFKQYWFRNREKSEKGNPD